jgi:hypothetical protein
VLIDWAREREPIGGSVLVEGQRIKVLRTVEGGIEYSVN